MNMVLKRRKRRPFGIRSAQGPMNTGHDKFVRGHVCALFGRDDCMGRMEAHHIREGIDIREPGKGPAGVGLKHPDSELVPLCSKHHSELHNTGCQTFEKKHHVDLSKLAESLWKASSHRIKYERSLQETP